MGEEGTERERRHNLLRGIRIREGGREQDLSSETSQVTESLNANRDTDDIDYKNRFKFYFTSTMSSTMTVVVVHYSPASTHPPASTAPPPIAASFSVTHHFVSCCCVSLVWYSQTLGYCMTRHSASTIHWVSLNYFESLVVFVFTHAFVNVSLTARYPLYLRCAG